MVCLNERFGKIQHVIAVIGLILTVIGTISGLIFGLQRLSNEGETGSSLVQCINSCGKDISCETKCVNEFKCQDQQAGCFTTTTTRTKTTAASTTTTSTTGTTTTATPTTTSTTTTSTARSTSITKKSTASTITTARPPNMDPNRKAVLVLSTYDSNNKPFIVDFNGNVNEDLTFEYGEETEIQFGCGALLRNVFWYFGGRLNRRQVRRIVGCKMERQTNLNFDFYGGACNTFNKPDPKILLCFDVRYERDCHTFDGQSYQSAGTSSYSHQYTYGLANYRGRALTTGCYGRSECGVKTELMDMKTLTWSIGPDYPFTSWTNRIGGYSTASTSEAAYIIGGAYTGEIIAQFKNDVWSQFGTLAKGRANHGSISLGNEFMVIGGSGLETEIWQFTNGNNKIINPRLTDGNYVEGIGLYVVPFNFCT